MWRIPYFLFIVNVMPLIVRFAGADRDDKGPSAPRMATWGTLSAPEWQNNGCLNFLRHKAIAEGYNARELQLLNGSEALYNYDFLGSADEELLYDELQRQIADVLRRLPERSRQVFVMSRFEGLKNKEIAERLDISVKVVEKHVTKSLAMLRKHILRHDNAELCLILLSWTLR